MFASVQEFRDIYIKDFNEYSINNFATVEVTDSIYDGFVGRLSRNCAIYAIVRYKQLMINPFFRISG